MTWTDEQRYAWESGRQWRGGPPRRPLIPFPLFALVVVLAVLAVTGHVAWAALWIALGVIGLLMLLRPRRTWASRGNWGC